MNTIVDQLLDFYEDHKCPGLGVCAHDYCLALHLINSRYQPQSEEPKEIHDKKASFTYFITFTKKPDVSNDYWFSRLCKQLERKFVKSFEVSIEHPDTNIHAHALIHSTEFIRKRHFESFPGHVDLKKILRDNGVRDYISKENKIFTDIINLKRFYDSSQAISPHST